MKRNLFEALSEGFQALKDGREGKLTLKQYIVEVAEAPQITVYCNQHRAPHLWINRRHFRWLMASKREENRHRLIM